MRDEITIRGLEVMSHVGVPDEERAHPQRLLVDVTFTPRISFESVGDDIRSTVDYYAASQRIVSLAAERPRRLIETLAADIAACVLNEFPAESVDVEVRKFILPNTEYVAVRCRRPV